MKRFVSVITFNSIALSVLGLLSWAGSAQAKDGVYCGILVLDMHFPIMLT